MFRPLHHNRALWTELPRTTSAASARETGRVWHHIKTMVLTGRVLLLALVAPLPSRANGNPNGLAQTPPMGWRSWNFMKQNVSQAKILAQVDAMVLSRHGNPSLLEVGYNHVGIDDGWQACGTGVNHSFHDPQGRPLINLTRFPDMLAMNRAAHAQGMKMGWCKDNLAACIAESWWCLHCAKTRAESCRAHGMPCPHTHACLACRPTPTDANNCGCSEASQFGRIGGHVRQDAEATAQFEFDSLKVDGCGPSQNITAWTAELNATGRPILLEDCLTKRYTKSGEPAPVPLKQVFIECPGNFFRLGSDIAPQFLGTMYNLIYTYNAMLPYQSPGHPASRPGCWTYNDMYVSCPCRA
mmetsp:Transcript_755/g.2168  ORF Transcript_755/g.2168 Transcript_755/m.2168 type:complete len:355 (-) Transcript_755:2498-3562(-)